MAPSLADSMPPCPIRILESSSSSLCDSIRAHKCASGARSACGFAAVIILPVSGMGVFRKFGFGEGGKPREWTSSSFDEKCFVFGFAFVLACLDCCVSAGLHAFTQRDVITACSAM